MKGFDSWLPSSNFHSLSKVRLSDIWYAYMEKYRTVDEMLESKVPLLGVLRCCTGTSRFGIPRVFGGICQTESLFIRSVHAVQHLTTPPELPRLPANGAA